MLRVDLNFDESIISNLGKNNEKLSRLGFKKFLKLLNNDLTTP